MARKKKFELNDNNLAIACYRFSSYSQNEASIDHLRRAERPGAAHHAGREVRREDDEQVGSVELFFFRNEFALVYRFGSAR